MQYATPAFTTKRCVRNGARGHSNHKVDPNVFDSLSRCLMYNGSSVKAYMIQLHVTERKFS
jgi:hypothetical protein